LCGDRAACNWIDYNEETIPPNYYYSSVPVYDEDGNMLFGGCEYESCLPPPPPPDEPPSETILIDTIDKYVEYIGINYLDTAYLIKYAGIRSFFAFDRKYDYNQDGQVGAQDLLSFLSIYGTEIIPEYFDGESSIGFIYYNDFIVEPTSNTQHSLTFIQDSAYDLPSSSDYNPLLGGENLIRYRAIKLLHIIATNQTTKVELKDLLTSWAPPGEELAYTAIRRGFNSPIYSDSYLNGQEASFGSGFLIEFLANYGPYVGLGDPYILSDELVFTA
jgi:hypothetical protein